MPEPTPQHIVPAHERLTRVRSAARRHWLGLDASPEHVEASAKIRRQYYATSVEFHKASLRLISALTSQTDAGPKTSIFGNRNVQLYAAYSLLWDAFVQIATAASHTTFALGDADRLPPEDEVARIARVLHPPFLTDKDFDSVTLLHNGEMARGAVDRLLTRESRELQEIYDIHDPGTLTDLTAFLEGLVSVTVTQGPDGSQERFEEPAWVVRTYGPDGRPLDLENASAADKYRYAVLYQCRQIRLNLNFIGKSEDSLDDALLMLRSFSLVEPLVGLMLNDAHRTAIFAL